MGEAEAQANQSVDLRCKRRRESVYDCRVTRAIIDALAYTCTEAGLANIGGKQVKKMRRNRKKSRGEKLLLLEFSELRRLSPLQECTCVYRVSRNIQ